LALIDALRHGFGKGKRTDARSVGGRYPPAMIATPKTFARVVATPVHLKRTLLIAFVVGSWLNLFNHGDELLHGVMSAPLAIKLVLNYLTPFVVSNFGLLAHQRH
jgi:hypothetical protein